MKRLVGALLVLSAAVTGQFTAVAAESAEVTLVTISDSTHDVVRVPQGCPDSGCPSPLQGRSKPSADITRFSAEYGTELMLTTEVRGIARRGYFFWRIRASGQDFYAAVIKRRGKVLTRFFDATFETSVCEGLRGGLDEKTYIADATVPSSCFGAPAHVRVGAQTAVVRSKLYAFFDDALREGFHPFRQSKPKLSERLDRTV